MDKKEKLRAEAYGYVLAAVDEARELLRLFPSAAPNASKIQRIFNTYAECRFLTGDAVIDDDGTVLQSAAWLCENRFDDFLEEISYALVESGVSRDDLMRVYLRHALRVLNENPLSLHTGDDDNQNAIKIVDELMRQRNGDEFLREKVSKLADGLPMPLGLHLE